MSAVAAYEIHRGYLPGCIGRVAELHARYYHDLVGFDVRFEAKVAREMAEFCERYVEGRDGLWLARGDDGVHGCIAIDGVQAKVEGAHLRWFIASDAARGSGVGKALLAAAMEFCKAQRYERVYLWTFEGLGAARHLYERSGFRLDREQKGTQWGKEVKEQRFEHRATA